MKAKINTKSNYRGLNGSWLTIVEIKGKRVSCSWIDEFKRKITIDFSYDEIEQIKN